MRGYVQARPDRCTCDAHYRADVSGPCLYPNHSTPCPRGHADPAGCTFCRGRGVVANAARWAN